MYHVYVYDGVLGWEYYTHCDEADLERVRAEALATHQGVRTVRVDIP